jgi:flagellar basal body-associated protein FliL
MSERKVPVMNLNNLNLNEKIEDLLAALKKKEDEKEKNTVLWVLAIIGAVAAVAGIAFAVYRFFAPDYLEDFEDDFDDDFDDYFEDEEE